MRRRHGLDRHEEGKDQGKHGRAAYTPSGPVGYNGRMPDLAKLAPTTKVGHPATGAIGLVLIALQHFGALQPLLAWLEGMSAEELQTVIDAVGGILISGAVAFGLMDARHAARAEAKLDEVEAVAGEALRQARRGPGETLDDDSEPEPPEPKAPGTVTRLGALLLISGSVTACAGVPGPGLSDVLARVDIGQVIRCAAEPGWPEKARCLGVEAMNRGLDLALDQAAALAEDARDAASGSGSEADDLTDEQRRELAADLDAALLTLEHEIAEARQ